MTITSYATLQSEVADFINRSDLTAKMPLFVQLAEATFNRVLRTLPQQAEVTLDLDSEAAVTLPATATEVISVAVREDVDRLLQYVTPAQYVAIRERSAASGPAQGYTILAGRIKLAPGAGNATQVRLAYYEKLAPLSDTNPSNWLLERAPDAYLYGTAAQAMAYLRDSEAAATFENAKGTVLQALIEEDKGQRYNGSPLLMRARPIGSYHG